MIYIERRRNTAEIHADFTGEKLHKKLLQLLDARIAHGQGLDFTGSLGDWKKTKNTLKVESSDSVRIANRIQLKWLMEMLSIFVRSRPIGG